MHNWTRTQSAFFDRLVRHISDNVESVNGWEVYHDDFLGTIFLSKNEVEVYLTPGWEGESLPVTVMSSDGVAEFLAPIEDLGDYATWSFDLDADTETWKRIATDYLASLPLAA